MPPAAFKDHFSSSATDYARWRPADYPPQLARWLAGQAPARALALDCGCGSGQFSTLLAGQFERVVATDASAQQLAQAQAHPRVSYRVAAAEHSGLDDRSVDLVSAAQAAHWFDLPAFYAEARRVLKPRGCLALVSYGVPRLEGAPGRLLDELHDRLLGPYWPPERRHVQTGYRLLDFPFDELAAPALQMRAQWTLPQMLGYIRTWSALRRAEAEHGPGVAGEVLHRLVAAWGDGARPRSIRWPLSLRVGLLAG